MSLLLIVAPCALVLWAAYRIYGGVLVRLFDLDPNRVTPAVAQRDDVDFAPIESKTLLSQHFSAIAAAGPIVGPILAGAMFGWLPALLWILVGSIFIGGVHDLASLVASIRHKARSIAEVVRDHMSGRAYMLFLSFVWLALIYIIVAFTDITASSFLGSIELENGDKVTGGGIATSSLMYLALPIIMALLMRYAGMSVGLATIIFLPLVGVAIWGGQYLPLDATKLFDGDVASAQRLLNIVLLGYCFVASIIPMWLMLQPRGHLGGYFLYLVLLGGGLGLIFGGHSIQYPAFTDWTTPDGKTLFPLLFITVACGACSGFHSIIASGTTSKQLRTESDAKIIGYGAMLMEAMVAIISLACVMKLATSSKMITDGVRPNLLYAQGIGEFLAVVGIPAAFGVSFGLMAFTTFVYDTLDICTRLGRYILQELFGWQNNAGRWAATAITSALPLVFLLNQPVDATGRLVPAWRVFWDLFGASNQLLAALTLLAITVWLWNTRRAAWVWLVTGLPAAFMYVMSVWALIEVIGANRGSDWLLARLWGDTPGNTVNVVAWVGVLLVALAALVLIEAVLAIVSITLRPRGPSPEAIPVSGSPAVETT